MNTFFKRQFERIHAFLWKIKVCICEIIRVYKYRREMNENMEFQGKYIGKRCFIIGNGPSLREEDLDLISKHGDFSFAANRIYKVFDDTAWRPSFYCVCDTLLFSQSKDEINDINCVKFVPLDIYDKLVDRKADYHVFSRIPFSFFNLSPKFSDKLNCRFGEGGTITYHMLQLAVSMGFKEIFLIGVDFSFSFGIGADGKYFEDKTVKHNHHKKDKSPLDVMPNLYMNLKAYKQAESFTKKHGIKIYNATRGGKLEVFERCSFDSLF